MRISTSMQYTQHLKYLQTANSDLDKASAQYNTGLKFQTAGEDPSGMSSKIKYTAEISAFDQFAQNAGMASDTLSEAETALSSMWTVLGNVQSRLIQAVNGTMDTTSLNAIAEDLEQAQAQLFDLMNTKNAEGEYIFSGVQSSQPTMTLRTDGYYDCQADGSHRSVQVSNTVIVQVSESGLNIFENCPLAPEFSIDTAYTPVAPTTSCTVASSEICSYDDYEDLYNEYFSTATNAPNNLIVSVEQVDPADPSLGRTFKVTDPDGNEIYNGEVTSDGYIEFKGLKFDVSGNDNVGEFKIDLEPIKKDNILNVLESTISTLRDPNISNFEKSKALAQAQVSVNNAQVQYDMYRGQIGARAQNIDSIINSNESLSVIKQTAKANVTEIDAFEAVSNMMQIQYGLQAAQQSYALVHSSSLFDFI